MGAISMAISGALTAIKMKFDGFGIIIIAFTSAVGGGTLRDMLLTDKEVFWLHDSTYIYLILIGAIIAIVFKSKQRFIYRPLMFFDAIGLGFFTILGVQIGINQGLDLIHSVLLGTITGTFGGIIRDILVNKIPVIFQKEIYATISLLGGLSYYSLTFTGLPIFWMKIIPIAFIIIARLIVLRLKLSLPSIYSDKEE